MPDPRYGFSESYEQREHQRRLADGEMSAEEWLRGPPSAIDIHYDPSTGGYVLDQGETFRSPERYGMRGDASGGRVDIGEAQMFGPYTAEIGEAQMRPAEAYPVGTASLGQGSQPDFMSIIKSLLGLSGGTSGDDMRGLFGGGGDVPQDGSSRDFTDVELRR